MKPLVTGAPSWMRVSENKRGTRLKLRGNRSWAGQPVIDRVRIRLRDGVTGVSINQGMLAQVRVAGSRQGDRIVFGDQAGTITKRFNSIINFGKDNEKDVFTFRNTTREHGPFNHMQRIRITNFGREDVIRLQNIGRAFRFKDLERAGTNKWVLPGVSPASLEVFT